MTAIEREEYSNQLVEQIEANEKWATISSEKTAKKLLRVAKKMKKELYKINPVSEETKKLSDKDLLQKLGA